VTVLGAAAGFVVLTLVGSAAYLVAPGLVAFFVPDEPDVIADGARFIRIMCLAWGAIGVQLSIVSAFRASGNMLAAMVIALVAQFMLQFPLAYILAKHTSLQAAGLWWSFPITNIVVAIVSLCWFAAGGWKKTRLTDEDIQVAEIAEKTITEENIR
jgi:Na+-driven multidrug efflux pump